MKLFDLLRIEMPSLKPEDCKIHLAGWNGLDDPLDIFLAGQFSAWQEWQSNKNFERPYIVSLIKMGGAARWLFAGVHSTAGCSPVTAQVVRPWDKAVGYGSLPTDGPNAVKPAFRYQTKELPEFHALTGRLIIEYLREARQSYRNAETLAGLLMVSELKPRRLAVEDFPGFSGVLLPRWKLDIIVTQELESWKSALSSVAGVYLITDTKTGRHYVGSAYGAGGIWARWQAYAASGHGNNKILKALLNEKGSEYGANFQYSILETADISSSEEYVLRRESHWKDALCSRESHGGYNAN